MEKILLQLQYSRNMALTMNQKMEKIDKPLSTFKENISLKRISWKSQKHRKID